VEIEALKIAADTMGAAIRRMETKSKLRRQVAHLNALRTIDHAIANSLDLRLTLDVVLDQVTGQLGVDAARVLLLDPLTQKLEFMAGRGFIGSEHGPVALRIGEGFAGRVALSRQPFHVPDLRRAAATAGYGDVITPPGFFSYYALPLIAKNQIKGVLETFCRTAVDSDDEWCGFAATLAGQAAIAP
jgi:signal transduction protein with GAF and PtsI domain